MFTLRRHVVTLLTERTLTWRFLLSPKLRGPVIERVTFVSSQLGRVAPEQPPLTAARAERSPTLTWPNTTRLVTPNGLQAIEGQCRQCPGNSAHARGDWGSQEPSASFRRWQLRH